MWLKIGMAGQITVEVFRIEFQPLGHRCDFHEGVLYVSVLVKSR